jgi:putative ABC transport system permease protein
MGKIDPMISNSPDDNRKRFETSGAKAKIRWWLRKLFHVKQFNQELDSELQFHIEHATEANLRAGMSPKEARHAALREFGGVELAKEECRDVRPLRWLKDLWQDARYGLRVLRKSPGFTVTAILTLALGIGANVAIFSVVNATILRPLPFPNSGRMYLVRRANNQVGGPGISLPIYLAWSQRHDLFESIGIFGRMSSVAVMDRGEPKSVHATSVTSEIFPALGVQPAIGRNFSANETREGGADVVIVSDTFWRASLDADPDVLGKVLTIDGAPFSVIGVMPRNFSFPFPGWVPTTQIWLPYRVPATSQNPAYGAAFCLGLVKPGVTAEQAQAQLTPALQTLSQSFPTMIAPSETARLELLGTFVHQWAGNAPLLLLGAVVLVLLIGCANVANLLLARATGRKREMAIRLALGGGRARIIRQLLTESVLLAVAGGALGLLICYACFNAILRLVPDGTAINGAIKIDGPVLAFAFVLSVLTGILFGLAPALGSSKTDLQDALKEAPWLSGARRERGRLRALLIVSEVALALVLLVGATLLLESFRNMLGVQPGFDPNDVLTVPVTLPQTQFPAPASQFAFFDNFAARLRSLPGVEQIAYTSDLPLAGTEGDLLFVIEGPSSKPDDERMDAVIELASPELFSTLRIPLLRGRVFMPADIANSEPVALINHAMAEMYFAGQDPIGQSVWIGKPMGPQWTDAAPRRIVGIVGDVRDDSLTSPATPTIYKPFAQQSVHNAGHAVAVLRTTRPPEQVEPAVREVLRAALPAQPVAAIQTLNDVVGASLNEDRFHTILLSAFGAIALLIVIVGVYGVISYFVVQRTHEIGVRLALGAPRGAVLRLVLLQGLRLTGAGIVLGLFASLALDSVLRSMLFGITPNDPATLSCVSAALLLIATIACAIPARRATRVDPIAALRQE